MSTPSEDPVDRMLGTLVVLGLALGLCISLQPHIGIALPGALLHLLGSAGLAALLLLLLVWRPGRGPGPLVRAQWLVPAGVLVIGLVVELLQWIWVPEAYSLRDLATDALGVFVGWAGWRAIAWRSDSRAGLG